MEKDLGMGFNGQPARIEVNENNLQNSLSNSCLNENNGLSNTQNVNLTQTYVRPDERLTINNGASANFVQHEENRNQFINLNHHENNLYLMGQNEIVMEEANRFQNYQQNQFAACNMQTFRTDPNENENKFFSESSSSARTPTNQILKSNLNPDAKEFIPSFLKKDDGESVADFNQYDTSCGIIYSKGSHSDESTYKLTSKNYYSPNRPWRADCKIFKRTDNVKRKFKRSLPYASASQILGASGDELYKNIFNKNLACSTNPMVTVVESVSGNNSNSNTNGANKSNQSNDNNKTLTYFSFMGTEGYRSNMNTDKIYMDPPPSYTESTRSFENPAPQMVRTQEPVTFNTKYENEDFFYGSPTNYRHDVVYPFNENNNGPLNYWSNCNNVEQPPQPQQQQQQNVMEQMPLASSKRFWESELNNYNASSQLSLKKWSEYRTNLVEENNKYFENQTRPADLNRSHSEKFENIQTSMSNHSLNKGPIVGNNPFLIDENQAQRMYKEGCASILKNTPIFGNYNPHGTYFNPSSAPERDNKNTGCPLITPNPTPKSSKVTPRSSKTVLSKASPTSIVNENNAKNKKNDRLSEFLRTGIIDNPKSDDNKMKVCNRYNELIAKSSEELNLLYTKIRNDQEKAEKLSEQPESALKYNYCGPYTECQKEIIHKLFSNSNDSAVTDLTSCRINRNQLYDLLEQKDSDNDFGHALRKSISITDLAKAFELQRQNETKALERAKNVSGLPPPYQQNPPSYLPNAYFANNVTRQVVSATRLSDSFKRLMVQNQSIVACPPGNVENWYNARPRPLRMDIPKFQNPLNKVAVGQQIRCGYRDIILDSNAATNTKTLETIDKGGQSKTTTEPEQINVANPPCALKMGEAVESETLKNLKDCRKEVLFTNLKFKGSNYEKQEKCETANKTENNKGQDYILVKKKAGGEYIEINFNTNYQPKKRKFLEKKIKEAKELDKKKLEPVVKKSSESQKTIVSSKSSSNYLSHHRLRTTNGSTSIPGKKISNSSLNPSKKGSAKNVSEAKIEKETKYRSLQRVPKCLDLTAAKKNVKIPPCSDSKTSLVNRKPHSCARGEDDKTKIEMDKERERLEKTSVKKLIASFSSSVSGKKSATGLAKSNANEKKPIGSSLRLPKPIPEPFPSTTSVKIGSKDSNRKLVAKEISNRKSDEKVPIKSVSKKRLEKKDPVIIAPNTSSSVGKTKSSLIANKGSRSLLTDSSESCLNSEASIVGEKNESQIQTDRFFLQLINSEAFTENPILAFKEAIARTNLFPHLDLSKFCNEALKDSVKLKEFQKSSDLPGTSKASTSNMNETDNSKLVAEQASVQSALKPLITKTKLDRVSISKTSLHSTSKTSVHSTSKTSSGTITDLLGKKSKESIPTHASSKTSHQNSAKSVEKKSKQFTFSQTRASKTYVIKTDESENSNLAGKQASVQSALKPSTTRRKLDRVSNSKTSVHSTSKTSCGNITDQVGNKSKESIHSYTCSKSGHQNNYTLIGKKSKESICKDPTMESKTLNNSSEIKKIGESQKRKMIPSVPIKLDGNRTLRSGDSSKKIISEKSKTPILNFSSSSISTNSRNSSSALRFSDKSQKYTSDSSVASSSMSKPRKTSLKGSITYRKATGPPQELPKDSKKTNLNNITSRYAYTRRSASKRQNQKPVATASVIPEQAFGKGSGSASKIVSEKDKIALATPVAAAGGSGETINIEMETSYGKSTDNIWTEIYGKEIIDQNLQYSPVRDLSKYSEFKSYLPVKIPPRRSHLKNSFFPISPVKLMAEVLLERQKAFREDDENNKESNETNKESNELLTPRNEDKNSDMSDNLSVTPRPGRSTDVQIVNGEDMVDTVCNSDTNIVEAVKPDANELPSCSQFSSGIKKTIKRSVSPPKTLPKGKLHCPKAEHKFIPQSARNNATPTPPNTSRRTSPTSARTRPPRDTLTSVLRKIESQKRQNLFPDDSGNKDLNIKMSQYIFK